MSTDSLEIKEVVSNLGLEVPFIRPDYLSTDEAGTYEVLLHAIKYSESKGINPEIIVLLQATSPFRSGKHIQEAIKLFNSELDMVVSVKETSSNPYYLLKEENELGYLENSKKAGPLIKSQLPKVWELNGAIYVINVKSLKKGSMKDFKKVKKYVMSEFSSIDIDTPVDWMLAEMILKRGLNDRIVGDI